MKKLTVREAAALLSASEKSAYRWIQRALLPATQASRDEIFDGLHAAEAAIPG